jgi:hypothetical protein
MHRVDVVADSLYEAVARGMKALQSKDWSAPGAFQVGYVDVTVTEPEVTTEVASRSSMNVCIPTITSVSTVSVASRMHRHGGAQTRALPHPIPLHACGIHPLRSPPADNRQRSAGSGSHSH